MGRKVRPLFMIEKKNDMGSYFDKVFLGGYCPSQVTAFVEESQKVFSGLREENETLKKKLAVLADTIHAYRQGDPDALADDAVIAIVEETETSALTAEEVAAEETSAEESAETETAETETEEPTDETGEEADTADVPEEVSSCAEAEDTAAEEQAQTMSDTAVELLNVLREEVRALRGELARRDAAADAARRLTRESFVRLDEKMERMSQDLNQTVQSFSVTSEKDGEEERLSALIADNVRVLEMAEALWQTQTETKQRQESQLVAVLRENIRMLHVLNDRLIAAPAAQPAEVPAPVVEEPVPMVTPVAHEMEATEEDEPEIIQELLPVEEEPEDELVIAETDGKSLEEPEMFSEQPMDETVEQLSDETVEEPLDETVEETAEEPEEDNVSRESNPTETNVGECDDQPEEDNSDLTYDEVFSALMKNVDRSSNRYNSSMIQQEITLQTQILQPEEPRREERPVSRQRPVAERRERSPRRETVKKDSAISRLRQKISDFVNAEDEDELAENRAQMANHGGREMPEMQIQFGSGQNEQR